MFGAEAPAYNPAHLPAAWLPGRRSRSNRDPPPAVPRRLSTTGVRRPPESCMAVRLQMKLGVIAETDHVIDSPDTVVVVEPSVGSVARSKGQPLPDRHVDGREPARPGGNAARRRDDPERVLLRRVGRDPGLHREGRRVREQAAVPPARPAGAAWRRRERADRDRRRGRSRQRALRRHDRAGRGLPHPPGTPLDATRPAPRARPADEGPRARRLARRDLGRRFTRAHLAECHDQARP